MELTFQVHARVARPIADVFEAVADPAQLSGYFTTGGAKGRLETGATVSWDFADFPGAFPVDVINVVPNERIALQWGHDDAGQSRTTVMITFEPIDGGTRTLVTITETGWPDTPEGLKASYGNCMGWSQMLAALKIWVEHGINLRHGMYR